MVFLVRRTEEEDGWGSVSVVWGQVIVCGSKKKGGDTNFRRSGKRGKKDESISVLFFGKGSGLIHCSDWLDGFSNTNKKKQRERASGCNAVLSPTINAQFAKLSPTRRL